MLSRRLVRTCTHRRFPHQWTGHQPEYVVSSLEKSLSLQFSKAHHEKAVDCLVPLWLFGAVLRREKVETRGSRSLRQQVSGAGSKSHLACGRFIHVVTYSQSGVRIHSCHLSIHENYILVNDRSSYLPHSSLST